MMKSFQHYLCIIYKLLHNVEMSIYYNMILYIIILTYNMILYDNLHIIIYVIMLIIYIT